MILESLQSSSEDLHLQEPYHSLYSGTPLFRNWEIQRLHSLPFNDEADSFPEQKVADLLTLDPVVLQNAAEDI